MNLLAAQDYRESHEAHKGYCFFPRIAQAIKTSKNNVDFYRSKLKANSPWKTQVFTINVTNTVFPAYLISKGVHFRRFCYIFYHIYVIFFLPQIYYYYSQGSRYTGKKMQNQNPSLSWKKLLDFTCVALSANNLQLIVPNAVQAETTWSNITP